MSRLSPFIQINTKTKLSGSDLRRDQVLRKSVEYFFVILLTNKLTNKQTDTGETHLAR